MAKGTETNIDVIRYPGKVRRDEKGFFVYIGVKAGRVTMTSLKFYVEEQFIPNLESIYEEEE